MSPKKKSSNKKSHKNEQKQPSKAKKNASDADDDEVKKTMVGLEALVAQCEHHLGGVKGAKTRFSSLVA